MYPIGTLKVAWVEKNPEYLSSDMFAPDQLNQAIAFGKKMGDFMIMELISQSKDYYRWRVLPYGNHKQYIRGMKIRRKLDRIFGNDESSFDAENIKLKLVDTSEEKQTQVIRLIDVFLIGPILIYASTFKTLPTYLRVLLMLIGIATIVYNGNNYLKNNK